METALILAETIFYFTVSLTIIIIGVLCSIAIYYLIRITQELKELSCNLNHAASDAGERINDIIDRLSDLPILSYFLKKHSVAHREKGRKKSFKKQKHYEEKNNQ